MYTMFIKVVLSSAIIEPVRDGKFVLIYKMFCSSFESLIPCPGEKPKVGVSSPTQQSTQKPNIISPNLSVGCNAEDGGENHLKQMTGF